jgi:protein O-GlcNAc transferase
MSQAIRDLLNEAVQLHLRGDFAASAVRYREVIDREPRNFQALHFFGRLRAQQQEFQEAADLIGRSLQVNPNAPAAHFNLGLVLTSLQRHGDAIESYRHALRIKPDFAEAHSALGNALCALGLGDAAADCYRRFLELKPGSAEGHKVLGNVLAALDRAEEASASYRSALSIDPDDVEALDGLGRGLMRLKRPGEALDCYRRALALMPRSPRLHNHLGSALNELNRHEEAERAYRCALALEPASAEVLNNLGIALNDLHRFAEAAQCLGQALQIEPNYGEAHSNLGNVYMARKRFEEAAACYRRALQNQPNIVDAQHNLGSALKRLERYDEAADCFRRALQLDPSDGSALMELALIERQICDWRSVAVREAQILEHVRRADAAIEPFSFLSFSHSNADQLRCAQNYWAEADRYGAGGLITSKAERHDKIRVAYLSSDFREHAVAYQVVELLERHDRSTFDIIAISFGPDDESAMRRRVMDAVDHFIDVRESSDGAVARQIAELSIDIAVDLNGLTAGNRRGILAYRPAPIQVNYLGYPATMGADFIDYIIVDPFVVPTGAQRFFSERLVHLPDCYLPNDSKREVATRTPSRRECSLPEHGFVFACFNNSYKITPQLFDIWCRLLRAVPDSVLWLRQDNPYAAANLRGEAQARGISPSRLIHAPRIDLAEHLARHRVADLFLDTLPYNAHSTGSDALWAGLPIISCIGETFASRVGGSLLRAVGLPELVTRDLAEYERLALELATQPTVLAGIRSRLARNLPASPLFDAERYRKNIEAAYLIMSDLYRRGEEARSFAVDAESEGTALKKLDSAKSRDLPSA